MAVFMGSKYNTI